MKDIIPTSVSIDQNGWHVVSMDPVIWAMVNAISELNLKVEELTKRIEKLEK